LSISVRGLWRSDSSKRWLVPLAIFPCLFGLALILAATVEAMAPAIYVIPRPNLVHRDPQTPAPTAQRTIAESAAFANRHWRCRRRRLTARDN
jgi:hypothetical protein